MRYSILSCYCHRSFIFSLNQHLKYLSVHLKKQPVKVSAYYVMSNIMLVYSHVCGKLLAKILLFINDSKSDIVTIISFTPCSFMIL